MGFDPDLNGCRQPWWTMQPDLLIYESREMLHVVEDGFNL